MAIANVLGNHMQTVYSNVQCYDTYECSRCELSHEIQTRLSLQPSITLQQTVWTGVDYCTDCTKNVPLSWGKAHSSNEYLLR